MRTVSQKNPATFELRIHTGFVSAKGCGPKRSPFARIIKTNWPRYQMMTKNEKKGIHEVNMKEFEESTTAPRNTSLKINTSTNRTAYVYIYIYILGIQKCIYFCTRMVSARFLSSCPLARNQPDPARFCPLHFSRSGAQPFRRLNCFWYSPKIFWVHLKVQLRA